MNITKKLTGAMTGLLVAATIFGFVAMPTAQALEQSQIDAILGLLQSFNAPASTLADVEAALNGQPTSGNGSGNVSSCNTYGTSSIVRVGHNGTNVQAIQNAMNQILDLSNGSMTPLVVDGAFGPLTKGVVQYFQGIIGTNPDGVWGPNTQAAYLTYVANNCDQAPVVVVPSGSWGVSAAASSPMASSLVSGQSSAKLLDLNFTGNGDVTSVKLMRTGVSSNNVLSNVYLFDGAVRLTDAASINNSGEIMFNVPSGIFNVNGSRTISVRADVSSTNYAGQTVGVNFVEAMAGSDMISGSAAGALFTVSYVSDLAGVSFSSVTPSGATLQPAPAVTVWQSTASISNHDVYMDRIAFRQIGSAQASAFGAFKLYVNGIEVAQAAGLDSNGYVTFVPASPVMMQAGSRIIRVEADIVSGSSRTVHFSLRNAADASFRDVQYNVNGTLSGSNISASTANTISGTSGGSMTVIKDTASPSTNIGVSASDVSLGHFKLTAYGEAIKVETLTAGFTSSTSTTALRNGRILLDGVPYGSQASLLASGTQFTVNKVINPGQSVIVDVRADVYASAGTAVAAGHTIQATLVGGSSNAQKMDSLGVLDIPTASVSANTLTVSSASVSLAKTTTYANQTLAIPATNYKLASWSLSGSTLEDVLVTGLTATSSAVVGTTFSYDDVTNLTLKVNGTVVSTPIAQATASNSFATQMTIAKNASALVELYGDLSNAVATDTHSMAFGLALTGISQPSGTAVSANATAQTIAVGAGTITATKDNSSPVAAIVYDNQVVNAANFKFESVNSGYDVTDMTFTIANASNVSSVDLYDGATLVASKAGATTVAFSGLGSAFNVGANSNKVLSVKLNLATAGFQNGTSGANVMVTLTDFTALSSAGTSYASSGTVAIESNPAGNAMYVYAGIPTISQGTIGATTLLAGERDFLKFKVSANGGDIAWNKIALDVVKTEGITLGSLALYDVSNGSTLVPATLTASADLANASTTSAGTIGIVPTNPEEITAGGSRDYVLRMTVGGTVGTGDYVTTKISADTLGYAAPTTYALADAAGTTSMVWSDMSAQSHATSTSDWSNGYELKTLPISETLYSILN